MSESTQRLEQLGGMIKDVDAANPTAEQMAQQQQAAQQQQTEQAQQQQSEQGAKDWALLMLTMGGFAQMIAPELKDIYTEERCLTWGDHANQVCTKYGLSSPSAMPELALIASTISFALPSYFAIRERVRDLKDAKKGGLSAIAAWWRNRGKPKPAAAEGGDGGQQ